MRSRGAIAQSNSRLSRHFVFDRALDQRVEADAFRCLYGACMQIWVDWTRATCESSLTPSPSAHPAHIRWPHGARPRRARY